MFLDEYFIYKLHRFLLNGFEPEDQFLSPRLHCISIDSLHILIINNGSSKIGIHSRNYEFHFCSESLLVNRTRKGVLI